MKKNPRNSRNQLASCATIGFALMLLVVSRHSVSAQTWSVDPNNSVNIYYNSGNVGIGTTSPSEKLDITAGAIQMSNSATAPTAGSGKFKMFPYDVFGVGNATRSPARTITSSRRGQVAATSCI